MSHQDVEILAVDDEPSIRRLLDVGLSSQGLVVQGVQNAKAATQFALENTLELVLLDLGLPDIGGHELLAKWRGENVSFPIVILSSRTDEAGICASMSGNCAIRLRKAAISRVTFRRKPVSATGSPKSAEYHWALNIRWSSRILPVENVVFGLPADSRRTHCRIERKYMFLRKTGRTG